ncbi:MAG TPA: biopolymer transporter ExbD [Verrucomicrobiae bacterium]|jgi:biopolymer transport protein ExbD
MRRFSQRNALVTLSEINITPLLDLAFVLLIIFVITTPLLEQGLAMNLPKGGTPDTKIEKDNVRTVEIDARGNFMLNRTRMTVAQIETELVNVYRKNPNLVVFVRADKDGRIEPFAEIMNRCIKNGITKFSFRTAPEKQ